MATIADLHISISDMSDEDIFNHIRNIRSLRREFPIKKVSKKKKIDNKQVTVEEYIDKIQSGERNKLLERLLKIKRERKDE